MLADIVGFQTDIRASRQGPANSRSSSRVTGETLFRVLIVDDEPTYREYLGSFLRRRGFEVRTAETGPEALEIARTFSPDVLLADWMLRCEMHGIQVGETLRADSPDLRILLMTGFPTASLEAEAARVGIDGFLEKPFALEDLSAALDSALDSALRSALRSAPDLPPALPSPRKKPADPASP